MEVKTGFTQLQKKISFDYFSFTPAMQIAKVESLQLYVLFNEVTLA
jgi:hypothetical protein